MDSTNISLQQDFSDSSDPETGYDELKQQELFLFIDFSAKDRQLLRSIDKVYNFYSSDSLQHFYNALISFPDSQSVFSDPKIVEEFKSSHQHFFKCMCHEEDNEKCINERKLIGVRQQELGLKTKWILGAYSAWLSHVASKLYTKTSANPLDEYNALYKLAFIDISLVFDINIYSDRQDSTLYLNSIVEHAADGLITIDESGAILFFNNTAASMFGYSSNEMNGKNIKMLMADYYALQHDKFIRRFIDSGASKVLGEGMREVLGKHKDGHDFPLDISISEVKIGNKRSFIGVLRDCTDRKKDQSQMLKLSRAIEQSADSIIITNYSGVIEYVNPSFSEVTGYSAAEAIGRTPNILKSGLQDDEFYKSMWKAILKGRVFRDVVINRKRDGSIYYEEKTITPLVDEHTGSVTHFISTGKDITDRMQAQQRLHYLAYYNALTELPNRSLYLERLNTAVTRAERHHNMLAVLILNMDRFKVINDTLGHEIGDSLLKEFTRRLSGLLRKEDTVAHLGGDTFAILIEEVKNIDDIPDFIRKIQTLFENSFNPSGYELYTSVSIGVSIYPQDGLDSSTLVRNAEVAMYRVKSAGRNGYQFYTSDMNDKALVRLELETRLRKAIESEQFLLYYQPQVDLNTRKIIGLEALVRWQHPELGIIPPNEFIPLLEETGLIIPAGEWILHQACAQNRIWRDMGLPHVRVSVNLSPLQFRQKNLSRAIAKILKKENLSPDALELELTESSIMQSEDAVLRSLGTLYKMGIMLAIDDFGTGYSCLSYLKNMPINVLKLDKSFVDGLPDDKSDIGIARAIIAMAHSLDMRVIAEGVEREEQLRFLQQENCDVIQGYLFSRPIPATDIPELLNSGKQL